MLSFEKYKASELFNKINEINLSEGNEYPLTFKFLQGALLDIYTNELYEPEYVTSVFLIYLKTRLHELGLHTRIEYSANVEKNTAIKYIENENAVHVFADANNRINESWASALYTNSFENNKLKSQAKMLGIQKLIFLINRECFLISNSQGKQITATDQKVNSLINSDKTQDSLPYSQTESNFVMMQKANLYGFSSVVEEIHKFIPNFNDKIQNYLDPNGSLTQSYIDYLETDNKGVKNV